METRANYIAVGIFTLVAAVATAVLVYWTSGLSSRSDLVPLDVRIEGSVSGLGPGSVVQFNGITVGRVEDLSLDTSDPNFVVVHTLVDSNTPVRSDTRASVGLRGLSGGAFIALEGGSADKAAVLVQAAASEEVFIPRIQGDPSAISDLIVRVNSIASQVETTMTALQAFVDENDTKLSGTFGNIEDFTKALAANSDNIGGFLESAGEVAKSLDGLSGKVDGTVSQVEAIVGAIEPDRVRAAVEGAAQFSETLGRQGETVDAIMGQLATAAGQVGGLANDLSATAKRAEAVVAAVEPERVRSTLENIDKAAEQVTTVLNGVEGETVNQAIENLAGLSADARKVVQAVDPERVASLVTDLSSAASGINAIVEIVPTSQINSLLSNLDAASAKAQEVLAGIDSAAISSTVDDISKTARGARDFIAAIDAGRVQALLADLSAASGQVARVVAAVDAASINSAVESVSRTAEGAQQVVEDVREVTRQFRDRGPDVQKVIDDAVELAGRLNGTSEKLDALVTQARGLLGSGTADGVVNDVQQTLAEFRETARAISREIATVSGSVTSFTRRGLGDTQTLIRDARQSLGRIDRVIRNLEANPSALISGSGGSRVRESGSARPRR
ncbi:MAG: MlaD family protein [Pseudomonadota bacterium]